MTCSVMLLDMSSLLLLSTMILLKRLTQKKSRKTKANKFNAVLNQNNQLSKTLLRRKQLYKKSNKKELRLQKDRFNKCSSIKQEAWLTSISILFLMSLLIIKHLNTNNMHHSLCQSNTSDTVMDRWPSVLISRLRVKFFNKP